MDTHKVEKLFLVARVSREDQRIALPAQEYNLKRYADQKGLPYELHTFDESAYKDDRRKFAALIEVISKAAEYCAVVFDKIDRYSRDISQDEVRTLSRMVKNGKLELHFPGDNVYVHKNSPASDKARLGMGLVFAEYNSAATSDNVRRRRADQIRDGQWLHQAPPGYQNARRSEEETDLIVNPKQRHFIIEAFELRSTGLAYSKIAKKLAADGFCRESGTRYTTKDIEKLINNPFYFGRMRIKGIEYDHKYEPIISRALFNKCQEIKKLRAHNPTKYASNEYALRGIIKCGRCGRSISPYKQKGKVYLHCANSKECRQPNASAAAVLPSLRADLALCKVPEEYIADVIGDLKQRHENQSSYFANTLNANRIEYDRLKKRLDVLYTDRLDGRISVERYDELSAEITAKQLVLNDEATNLTKDNKNFLISESKLLDLCQRAGQLFDSSQPALQRELLEVVLANCIMENKILSYSFKEPFDTVVRINKASAKGGSENANANNGWG